MKTKLKKLLALILTVSMIMSISGINVFAEPGPEDGQIEELGGKLYYDRNGNVVDTETLVKPDETGAVVSVSKTIAPAPGPIENVFDITLNVETTLNQKENYKVYKTPDSAVVLTIDMSGTMYRYEMNGTRHVEVAKTNAEAFARDYAASTSNGAKRMLAVVCFDTDANVALNWTDVSTEEGLADAIAAIEAIEVAENGNQDSKQVCTNFDGGLILTRNLLKASTMEQKFAIILSDGEPTVTVSGDSSSVGTISSSFTNSDGQYDNAGNKYGNQYKGGGWAHPAEMEDALTFMNGLSGYTSAYEIKDSDGELTTKEGIFVVGIGQDMGKVFIGDNTYTSASQYDYVTPVKAVVAAYGGDTNAVTNAYIDSMTTGLWLTHLAYAVNGSFVSAGNTDAVEAEFSRILAAIGETSEPKEITSDAWNAVDPIGGGATPYVDFMGFVVNDTYTGLDAINNEDHGDTAEWKNNNIDWDLKESTYTTNNGVYSYSLMYRVRLANEDKDFAPNTAYITNGTTTFSYATVENNEFTNPQTVKFLIPKVEGYLGEFSFTKLDENGNGMGGAKFTLTHAANCPCGGVDIEAQTAESAAGTVSFTDIPSGHSYVLQETGTIDGYYLPDTTWPVVVAYGETTVNGNTGLATVTNVPLGKLTVTKDVTGERDENDDVFTAGCFEFELRDASGKTVREFSLPVANNDGSLSWSVTLDKLDAGNYTVYEKESAVGTGNGYGLNAPVYSYTGDGSSVEVENNTTKAAKVTNTYTYVPNSQEIEVKKAWDDDRNNDGLRPDGVIFALNQSRVAAQYKILNAENEFKCTFNIDSQKSYTVEEVAYIIGGVTYWLKDKMPSDIAAGDTNIETDYTGVPGYTAAWDQPSKTITNSHKTELIDIAIHKVWDDSVAAEKIKPVTVHLLADGVEVDNGTVVLSEENDWSCVFTDLYKYDGGEEIEYTVTEDSLGAGFSASIKKVGKDAFIGSYKAPVWTEEELRAMEGMTEESIAQLVGTPRVDEADFLAGLNKLYGEVEKFFTVTNSYTTGGGGGGGGGGGDTSVTVVKVWNDDNDAAEIRPESITVILLENGKEYDTVELSEANNWKHTWRALPQKSSWSIEEVEVEGYTTSISASGNRFTITNTPGLYDIPEEEPPLTDIPEEKPPLVEVPKTGDLSALWLTLSALSGTGLAGLSFGTKKRKDEEDTEE